MTIENLKSGKYRVSEMRDGRRYRVVLDHIPSDKEANKIFNKMEGKVCNGTPFEEAANNYIELKSNVLSPSTIRGYRVILNNLDSDLLSKPLDKITSPFIQGIVNKLSVNHKPKTVKNINGFIVSVLKFYEIEIKSPTLPKRPKEDIYIPSEEDIKRILNDVKGTKYEIPFILGTLGLRRSEICALTKDDLNGNVLTINKALVENEKKEWIVKSTKTTESTRVIVIPEYLADLIREKGIYDSSPHSLYSKLKCVQDRLGIERFSFHKLRHFFASYMHNLGYTDKQIQAFGGWKTDAIMKTVYQHAMDMDKTKVEMANNIGSLIG